MKIVTYSYHKTSQKPFRSKKLLAVYCIATLAAGMLSGFLVRNAGQVYAGLAKPPFSPPALLFPIVWTVLYLFMAVAVWRAHTSLCLVKANAGIRPVLLLYILQLALNVAWPVLFFETKLFFLAFLWLLILFACILFLTVLYGRVDRLAVALMLPYLLWTMFAGYLNLGVAILNG